MDVHFNTWVNFVHFFQFSNHVHYDVLVQIVAFYTFGNVWSKFGSLLIYHAI